MADRDDKPTEVGYLYSKEGREILPASRAQYDELWDQGWRHTPWAFGIETHPAAQAHPLSQPSPVSSAASAPGPDAARLDSLERRLAALEGEMALMQASQEGVGNRLGVLEGAAAGGASTPTVSPPPTTSLSTGHAIELEAAQDAEEQRAGREALGREPRRATAQPGDPGTAAAAHGTGGVTTVEGRLEGGQGVTPQSTGEGDKPPETQTAARAGGTTEGRPSGHRRS